MTLPDQLKHCEGMRIFDFTQHEITCLLGQWREGRPTKDGGYETKYGYGKQGKWYQKGEQPKCSCGLDEAEAEVYILRDRIERAKAILNNYETKYYLRPDSEIRDAIKILEEK